MLTVADLMKSKPFSVRATDTLGHAEDIMARRHVRHLPVVTAQKWVVGIISQRDLLM